MHPNALTFAAQLCALAAAATAQQPPPDTGSHPEPARLVAEHLYNGVNRPCIVDVSLPRTFGTATLALMDHDGVALAPPVQVHPGRVDLAEAIPEGAIWKLQRAAFLQLLDGDQPVGPALVLQPLLSRMVPKTEIVARPNGAAYTKIIGWLDESQLPPPTLPAPATTAPAAPAPPPVTDFNKKTEDKTQKSDGSTPPESSPPATPPPPKTEVLPAKPIFSGLRIYPETDVVLRTTKGDIRVAFRPDEAPNTAWNFLELSRGGFYRNIPFHRVVPFTASSQPFVIQAGDPSMTPSNGASRGVATGDGGPGYWLPIEDSRLPHDFGVISMARNDDPDSNGSQFFFALSREGCARLDGQYCSFGYAVDGAETIKSIAQTPLAGNVSDGRPIDPPMIKDADLVPAPPRKPGEGRSDRRVTVENPRATETRPARVPR